MDVVLVILGLICVLVGIAGVFIPGLPGPPLSWVGILLLYCTSAIDFNFWVLIPLGLLAIASLILEYTIPAYGTKVFKGTKFGVRGSYVGLIIGIIFPFPFSFILGPLIGAFAGEMYHDNSDWRRALKAAFGTFLGFLLSTLINFTIALVLLVAFVIILIKNFNAFF
ncbi:MAG: DUF456 domain-containing protein [Flavobacteriia bacterium]|jgi:hypothetical protein|nr:DUF456 domain-containing protein [Flavobacteriia bacterium]NBV68038.1 DUF456 domain-containing protein [Flavobacteriia bacterium]